jgi:hypothetical protein
MTGAPRDLHPREVLADLLGSGDFPAEVLDAEGAAKITIERLIDAGFTIVSADREQPSRWLRLYTEVVSDPKVQRLPGEKFKAWINLLCVAGQNDGILPPLADLAFTLRVAEDTIALLLADLADRGLLDATPDDRYTLTPGRHGNTRATFQRTSATAQVTQA